MWPYTKLYRLYQSPKQYLPAVSSESMWNTWVILTTNRQSSMRRLQPLHWSFQVWNRLLDKLYDWKISPCITFHTIQSSVCNVSSNKVHVRRAGCTASIRRHGGATRSDWVWITYSHNLVHYRGELWLRFIIQRGRTVTSKKPAMGYCRAVQPVKHFTIFSENGVWYYAAVLSTTPNDFGYTQYPIDLCPFTRNPGIFVKVIPARRIIDPRHFIPEDDSNSLAIAK